MLKRPKRLIRPMQWQKTLGGREAEWLGFDLALQFVDEPEVFPEGLKVVARWHPQSGRIPASASFNLLYRSQRVYAVDALPGSRHKNNMGAGMPFHGQLIYGSHVHIWCSEGGGYAEPLPQFVAPIDVEAVWDYFLLGSGIKGLKYVDPDEGSNFGQGRLL